MENISHSLPLPKRSFFSNPNIPFTSHKSIYDDVFAAPKNFDLPALAPRLEDYSEIFGGFHASRPTSIPLLHVPSIADDSDLHFDVGSPGFDYSEVFGDLNGFGFTASFQDVFGQSSGGYNSSEEQWSPAQSESVSDELDPIAGSDKRPGLSDIDLRVSPDCSLSFSVSNPSNMENVVTAVPGNTFTRYESPIYGEDDIELSKELDVDEDDLNGNSSSVLEKPFVTISDISLRTKPSQLPPPSRPPPALAAVNSKSKERVVGDGAPLVFNAEVEVDDNAFHEARTKRNENVQLSDENAKLSIERNDIQNLGAMQVGTEEVLESGELHRCNSIAGKSDGSVSWRESTDYFDLTEEKMNRHAFDMAEGCETGRMEELPVWDVEKNQPETTNDWSCKLKKGKGITRSNSEKGFLDKVMYDSSNTGEIFRGNWDTEDMQMERGEIVKGPIDVIEMESKFEPKAFPRRMDTGKKFLEESQRRFKQDDDLARPELGNEHRLTGTFELEEDVIILKDIKQQHEIAKNAYGIAEHEFENRKERLVETVKNEVTEEARTGKEQKLISEWEVNRERSRDTSQVDDNDKEKGSLKSNRNVDMLEELCELDEEIELIERNGHVRVMKLDQNVKDDTKRQPIEVFDGEHNSAETVGCKYSEKNSPSHPIGSSQASFSSEQLKTKTPTSTTHETESRFSIGKEELQNGNIAHSASSNSVEEVSRVPSDKKSSVLECSHESERTMPVEDYMGKKTKGQTVRVEDELAENAPYSTKSATKMRVERKDQNIKETIAVDDKKVWGRMKRETEIENELMRKLEEEKEREREREKDRMAVDKSSFGIHERSQAEARERAAVERASAEARQRALAGARERLERSAVETRLKAERAIADSRLRPAESRVERSVADRFSASFRSADTRQSSLSSDLHFRNAGNSNVLQYSYSSSHTGTENESPQRCKARLERYRRTAERAANALAEKNRRDLLAQREREERNRIADILDTEVKRWSNGKEGNLRALLSTLQYILGPDSGWQPIPLTEVITSAAVRRSYRKATLCVHPDKLQQRGATIQQKYISEKVFDLLKEAWNKFNSEEQ